MFIFYDIFFFITALVYLPYLLWKRKWHGGFWRRCAISLGAVAGSSTKKTIWVHAVSVGEVLTIVPLVESIRQRFAEYRIVLSVVTPTGYELAQKRFNNTLTIVYAPLDFSWVVRRYLDVLKPVIYISAETEWWPNLYAFLYHRRIPIVQVNGRVSDRAFQRYQFIAPLTRKVLACIRLFCMQSALDADRVIGLGADVSRVRVMGNLKFDYTPPSTSFTKEILGFDTQDQLIIAGSTHPGEEQIMLDIYARLGNEFPSLRLVLAPRHVGRSDEVVRLCQARGFCAQKFSELPPTQDQRSDCILIVDRIGCLNDLYSLAELVVIGKTFCGRGGQNMLEPLRYCKPTLVGPHTENFRDIVRIFLKTGALIEVKDKEELMNRMRRLLSDPKERLAGLTAAQEEFTRHQGATVKTMEGIAGILNI